jgi:hypothetical protein
MYRNMQVSRMLLSPLSTNLENAAWWASGDTLTSIVSTSPSAGTAKGRRLV